MVIGKHFNDRTIHENMQFQCKRVYLRQADSRPAGLAFKRLFSSE